MKTPAKVRRTFERAKKSDRIRSEANRHIGDVERELGISLEFN